MKYIVLIKFSHFERLKLIKYHCDRLYNGETVSQKLLFKIITLFLFRQQEACTTFETMSQKAKEELKLQRERRVLHFQKSLSELAELEVIEGFSKL